MSVLSANFITFPLLHFMQNKTVITDDLVSKLDIQWFKDWSYQFRDRLSTQLQAVAYAIYMPFHKQVSKILGLDLNYRNFMDSAWRLRQQAI